MPRRPLDFYETPPHYIAALLGDVNIFGHVYEPCVGEGAIADALKKVPAVRSVVTNDIDHKRKARNHQDARTPEAWIDHDYTPEWAITNPPFSDELAILEQAIEHVPNVAFLARISFLEPTEDRETFLEQHPPRRVIYLPRYSFRLNDAGKKQTDNVTCAWLVWGNVEPGIAVWGRGKSQGYAVMRDLL